jgi:hypothetical protein
MKRVRDYVKFGSPKDLSVHLKNKIAEFESEATRIWSLSYLDEACRVFPNVLRCIARQLRLLEGSSNLPVEAAAGACRIVFELNLRVRLMMQKPEFIRTFLAERLFEEISLLNAIRRLADKDTDPSHLKSIDSRIEEIQRYIAKHKVSKPEPQSTFHLAEATGLEEEYKSLYGFYSKYTHASSWLVNATFEGEGGDEGNRNIFQIQTQLYAFESLKRIQDFVLEKGEKIRTKRENIDTNHSIYDSFLQDSDPRRHKENISGYVSKRPDKVGRNDPCPCGSGKKYKRCCLKSS